jgi:5-methyltetrahydrofolate--homocysteine methyltransferase
LAEYIDWTPFFQTWELTGRFPAILDDPKIGEVARSLYDDARKMLDLIVKEKWFTAARHHRLLAGQCRRRRYRRLCRRQPQAEDRDLPHAAPATGEARRPLQCRAVGFHRARFVGVPDYIGAFVVTAGIGEDAVADRFKNANDDYSSILCKALADRLAEAFAERMHQRVRKEFWGYAPDETLAADQLILEQYAGIRPAPGYPAQPDHTEKATLFRLLDAENTAGVKLTESFAMWPGSSVSGLYFSIPKASISASARSSATRSRTTPRARA